MSDLAKIMKAYVRDIKSKLDFNNKPGEVLFFLKEVPMEKIRDAYFIMTGKDWSSISDIQMLNEMIFILLNTLRGNI